MNEGFNGIASTLKNLQEVATSGGDEQLRALGHKIKDAFRAGLRHALVESTTDVYGLFGASITDPLDFSSGTDDGWGGYPYTSPAYYIQNMKRGEVLPAYLYEQQLRIYRDRSRKLCQENEYAICATENRKNYAVGAEGFQHKIVSAKQERFEGMDKLLTRAQWVTDHWVEHNDMAEYAKDLMHRLDVDGEAFTRFFPQSSGLVTVRTVEAEHVRAPTADYGPHYSFGIQTDPEDVETREGYWIVEDPSKGWVPSFVPAEEISHIKLNTPRSAKRGLPTFYPCEQLLRIASDLLVGVAKNANHRAKIAMVRTVTGAMASAAQSMMDELKDVQIMDPSTGNSINVEKFNWGTILTQPDNVKTEFPNANFDSSNFDVALQMILRAVAARLVMPEWMLTVNAQNSNFSSSLIAEAPSTKAFEDLQQMLLKRIGTNRMRSRESMLWYQIRHAVRVGLLPPETLQLVKIESQGPSLIVRDKTGEASQNKLYYDMRAKSKRVIQMENNWDPEQIRKDFEEDDAEQLRLQAVQAEQEMKIQQAQMQQQAEQSLLGMAPNADVGGGGGEPGDNGPDVGGAPQQFPESGPNGGPGAGRLPAREGLEESVLKEGRKPAYTLDKHNEIKSGLHTGELNYRGAEPLSGGTSQAWKVPMSNGVAGVYKPSHGERSMRSNVPEGQMHRREAGASDVADLVGMHHMVPPTITRDHDGPLADPDQKFGSVQLFVPGTQGHKMDGPAKFGKSNSDIAKAGAFDYLIGNSDRHAGNHLIHKGAVQLIDHGHAFPEGDHGVGSYNADKGMIFHHEAAKRGLPIPQEFHDLKWDAVKDVMDKHGMSDKAQKLTKMRLGNIQKSKHIHELPFVHHEESEFGVPYRKTTHIDAAPDEGTGPGDNDSSEFPTEVKGFN